jgi:hypothetical protein
LLLAEGVHEDVARSLRRTCLEACEALIRDASRGTATRKRRVGEVKVRRFNAEDAE